MNWNLGNFFAKAFGVARCEYCGRTLSGRYMTDQWGTVFCPEHVGKWPPCTYCGRLVDPGIQKQGSHDAVRCRHCKTSEIRDLSQARPLFAELIKWVNGRGLKFNNLPLRVEFRTREEINRQMQGGGNTLGFCLRTRMPRGGERDEVRVEGVALLKGLPGPVCRTTIVHELGHAWVSVHQLRELPAWFEEGFCQYLAHLHCTDKNTKELRFQAEMIEKRTDPIYGDGFRRFQAAAGKMGFSTIVDHMRNHVPFTI